MHLLSFEIEAGNKCFHHPYHNLATQDRRGPVGGAPKVREISTLSHSLSSPSLRECQTHFMGRVVRVGRKEQTLKKRLPPIM